MILKGKLTKLSAAVFAIIQIPNLLADVNRTAQVFSEAAQQPISYLSLVAAVGVIWGGIRRAMNYDTPRITFAMRSNRSESDFTSAVEAQLRDELRTLAEQNRKRQANEGTD